MIQLAVVQVRVTSHDAAPHLRKDRLGPRGSIFLSSGYDGRLKHGRLKLIHLSRNESPPLGKARVW